MKNILLIILLFIQYCFSSKSVADKKPLVYPNADNSYVGLSQQFLYAVKTDGDYQYHIQTFCKVRWYVLADELKSDMEMKAFWLNIYNAYIQILLKFYPDVYKDKNNFFRKKQICIAGKKYSFNDIEHTFLRRSRYSWGKGYIKRLYAGKLEKLFRVKSLDNRIHFALNCGAMGCPPIRYYETNLLDEQLNTGVQNYLFKQVKFDEKENIVYVPEIFNWYSNDFGGKNGIIAFLKRFELISEKVNPTIKFTKYNWELNLGNFIE